MMDGNQRRHCRFIFIILGWQWHVLTSSGRVCQCQCQTQAAAADIVVVWRESHLNMKYWLPGIRMYLDCKWAAGGR